MAESKVTLRMESQEYEQKLKRATNKLLEMEAACKKVGGTMAIAEQKDIEFARSLGSMETKAKDAKGRINELTKAFTETSLAYKRLTDEEKQSPYGQALAKSATELKGRLNEAKTELASVTGESTKQTSAVGELISKYGGFATALAAGKAALEVMKDAFLSSESNVDEWGRTVESARSVYDSFCIGLNNGNLSGWFSNMDNLIQKAKDAYNAMDELNTQMTIINPQRAKIQTLINEQKEIIRKQGKDSAAGKQAQAMIRQLEPQLKGAYQKEADMNFKAFEAEVDKKLAEAGINLDSGGKALLMQSFTDANVYEKIRRNAKGSTGTRWVSAGGGSYKEDYDTRNANQKILDTFTDEWRTKYSQYITAGWNARGAAAQAGIADARYLNTGGGSGSTKTTTITPKVEVTESITELMRLEDELKTVEASMKPYGKASDDWKSMNEYAEGIRKRIKELNGETDKWVEGISGAKQEVIDLYKAQYQQGAKDSAIGSADYNQNMALLADTTAFDNLTKMAAQYGVEAGQEWQETMLEKIASGEGVEDADWQSLVDKINEKLKELEIDPIKLDVQTGNLKNMKKEVDTTSQTVQGMASAFSAVGNALNQLDDPGAKVAGYVASAIGQVAAGYGAATAQAATMGPWAWIAFAATGLATMIATIAGIKNATAGSYATGGIIPGNSVSGDNLTANVNSGELILNKAQQGNLASQLSGTGFGALSLSATIKGEDIRLALNNSSRRRGNGEYVTSKSL